MCSSFVPTWGLPSEVAWPVDYPSPAVEPSLSSRVEKCISPPLSPCSVCLALYGLSPSLSLSSGTCGHLTSGANSERGSSSSFRPRDYQNRLKSQPEAIGRLAFYTATILFCILLARDTSNSIRVYTSAIVCTCDQVFLATHRFIAHVKKISGRN
ncbi:unnamed protein product [Protopolystoma xenopodis]|uniref:Uncharacterized protein n=1 Tax=Protopolystoma xenopodis TaxID=117903 RepID=A0A3S5B2H1_9PLAT|nr:unnamed protein product [Protopolystoma xenopodis]